MCKRQQALLKKAMDKNASICWVSQEGTKNALSTGSKYRRLGKANFLYGGYEGTLQLGVHV